MKNEAISLNNLLTSKLSYIQSHAENLQNPFTMPPVLLFNMLDNYVNRGHMDSTSEKIIQKESLDPKLLPNG